VTLLLLLVAVTGRGMRRTYGRARMSRRDAFEVAALFAATGMILAAAFVLSPRYPWSDVLVIGFHLALAAGVLRLTAGLIRSDRAALTDLVASLDELPSTTVGGELARLLDEPGLRIGLRSGDAPEARDELGDPVEPPQPGSGLTEIDVVQDGRSVAVIVCRPGTLDDSELRQAVVDAVRMAATNHALRSRVAARVAELEASRRRLIVAADEAGERLAQRVRDGALRHLAGVESELRAAAAFVSIPSSVRPAAGERQPVSVGHALESAIRRVERAADDLRSVAHGLDPRPLTDGGFAQALGEIAAESPVPVELDVRVDHLTPELARDAYLVAAEALANVAKHASARRARITAAIDGRTLRVVITDDGAGGATLEHGTGLRGLADRAASLGGTLRIRSEAGRGTTLLVDWPLQQDSAPALPHGIVETRRSGATISTAIPDGVTIGAP
jgi:signal transduction histidine kinase